MCRKQCLELERFHKPFQAQTQTGWWSFPLRTITVAVTARRIGEAVEQGGEVEPEIFLQEFAVRRESQESGMWKREQDVKSGDSLDKGEGT